MPSDTLPSSHTCHETWHILDIFLYYSCFLCYVSFLSLTLLTAPTYYPTHPHYFPPLLPSLSHLCLLPPTFIPPRARWDDAGGTVDNPTQQFRYCHMLPATPPPFHLLPDMPFYPADFGNRFFDLTALYSEENYVEQRTSNGNI